MSYDPYMALAVAIAFGRPIAGEPLPRKVALRERTNQSTKWSWMLNAARDEHAENFAFIKACSTTR